MNDLFEYYLWPQEQMFIDKMKRSQQVVDEYAKIVSNYKETMESVIENQKQMIDQLKQKCKYYDEYIHKKV